MMKKLLRASHRALYRLRGRVQHMDARSKKKFKTRDASRFAFHHISDVSCNEASAEVPYVNDLVCRPDDDCFFNEDDGGCDTAPLMTLSLTERDGPHTSAQATLLDPAPVMPPMLTSRSVSQITPQVASPASSPSTPPPTAPPPSSCGTRGRFNKMVAPAGDWIYTGVGGAVRRSVRIASMQPPRRSPRLAALPRISYRRL